jgi:hypothetical protein
LGEIAENCDHNIDPKDDSFETEARKKMFGALTWFKLAQPIPRLTTPT